MDHKKEKGKTVYRVRWKGYPAGQDSWLPGAELSCKDLLKRYKKKTERETKDVYTVSILVLWGNIHTNEEWNSLEGVFLAQDMFNCAANKATKSF